MTIELSPQAGRRRRAAHAFHSGGSVCEPWRAPAAAVRFGDRAQALLVDCRVTGHALTELPCSKRASDDWMRAIARRSVRRSRRGRRSRWWSRRCPPSGFPHGKQSFSSDRAWRHREQGGSPGEEGAAKGLKRLIFHASRQSRMDAKARPPSGRRTRAARAMDSRGLRSRAQKFGANLCVDPMIPYRLRVLVQVLPAPERR